MNDIKQLVKEARGEDNVAELYTAIHDVANEIVLNLMLDIPPRVFR